MFDENENVLPPLNITKECLYYYLKGINLKEQVYYSQCFFFININLKYHCVWFFPKTPTSV